MDFTQPWDYGDVTFVVEDKKIHINKTTLGMSSEVFKAMFTSDFAEKKMTEIPLPGKKFDDFLQLMQILHPQVNKWVDESNVEILLQLAHEYQIHHVVEQCEKYLLTQPPSIHNLILADKFSLTELRQVSMEYMKTAAYGKLKKDPEFEMISKDTASEVIERKLELHEGNDPLKDVICEIMSNPSIENLLLAEEYDVPKAYKTCLDYIAVEKTWDQIKSERGFRNLKPDNLIKILTLKVEKLEKPMGMLEGIIDGSDYERGLGSWCYEGKTHRLGANSNCDPCMTQRYTDICLALKDEYIDKNTDTSSVLSP